jgi:hypothetical protein
LKSDSHRRDGISTVGGAMSPLISLISAVSFQAL